MDAAINIIITSLTMISALINKLRIEKSALDVNPTACDAISASISSSHTKMCHEYDSIMRSFIHFYKCYNNN